MTIGLFDSIVVASNSSSHFMKTEVAIAFEPFEISTKQFDSNSLGLIGIFWSGHKFDCPIELSPIGVGHFSLLNFSTHYCYHFMPNNCSTILIKFHFEMRLS